MLPKSHRLIGIIRIQAPVMEIADTEDDDSTIGGLLAGFAQRSLLSDAACLSRFSTTRPTRPTSYAATTGSVVPANLKQLMCELETEFSALGEVSA
jgi:hypothetical protein